MRNKRGIVKFLYGKAYSHRGHDTVVRKLDTEQKQKCCVLPVQVSGSVNKDKGIVLSQKHNSVPMKICKTGDFAEMEEQAKMI